MGKKKFCKKKSNKKHKPSNASLSIDLTTMLVFFLFYMAEVNPRKTAATRARLDGPFLLCYGNSSNNNDSNKTPTASATTTCKHLFSISVQ